MKLLARAFAAVELKLDFEKFSEQVLEKLKYQYNKLL